jgi:hypothetical protein
MTNFYPTLLTGRNLTGQKKRPINRAFTVLGILILMGLLSVKVAFGQTTIYSTNFGGTAVSTNPLIAGQWTTPNAQTGGVAPTNITISTSSASNTYTTPISFSGGANLADGNSGPAIGTATALLAGSVNTNTFTNIQVSFGYRASSSSYTATVTLEWSPDGTTWNNIALGTLTRDGAWRALSFVTLPAGAENQSNLRFRFTFARTTTGGNFRIDDFTVRGTATTPTVSVTGSFNKFYANQGQASEAQSVSVSGNNLTANLNIGPLTGYEFSTAIGGPYSTTLSFTPSGGTVSPTTVFARLNNTLSAGNYTGTLDFASAPATTVTRTPDGQVYASPGTGFVSGNIVTLRVGESGGPALTSSGAPIFLDEYTPTGTFVKSFPLPFSVNGLNRRFTMSGTSTSEGYLNLSPDGQYLTFAGYDAIPGTASIIGTSAATTNRIVSRVTQNGTINTTTRINDGYDANNIRSAATVDGNAFWTGGAGSAGTGGTRYMPLGNTGTSTQVSTTITNSRGTAIYNSQLFASSQSGSNRGVNTVGTGLPTTTGNSTTILSGLVDNFAPNAHGFVFVDVDDNGTPDVMYVADADATNGGLMKFSNTAGTWTARGRLPNPSGRAVYGVTATVITPGTDRRIYLNLGTTSTIATEIYTFVDNSPVTANITSNGTDITAACGAAIITAPSGVGFKGVSFTPVDVPTPTVNHTFTSAGTSVAQGTINAPLYRIQCDILMEMLC